MNVLSLRNSVYASNFLYVIAYTLAEILLIFVIEFDSAVFHELYIYIYIYIYIASIRNKIYTHGVYIYKQCDVYCLVLMNYITSKLMHILTFTQ